MKMAKKPSFVMFLTKIKETTTGEQPPIRLQSALKLDCKTITKELPQPLSNKSYQEIVYR
jgi:hypothetical protein